MEKIVNFEEEKSVAQTLPALPAADAFLELKANSAPNFPPRQELGGRKS